MCLILAKYCSLYGRFVYKFFFVDSSSYFLGMIMLISISYKNGFR